MSRKRLDELMNHPVTDAVVMVMILASVALLLFEVSVEESHWLFEPAEILGHVFTGLFALELLLRFLGMPSRRRFLRMYWLDLLAVLPVVRTLRILRVLRILRLFRAGAMAHRRMALLDQAVRQGGTELLTVVTVVLVVVLTGAIGMNLVERGVNPEVGSLGDSIWSAMYTIVAGEPQLVSPRTTPGRFITYLIMLGGLCFFAMFTGIVSAAMMSRMKSGMEVKVMALDDVKDHVVMCGWNHEAIQVLEEFQADPHWRDKPVVVVAELEALPDLAPHGIRQERVLFVQGDYTRVDVLQKAGVERAAIAILLSDKTGQRSDQDRDARTVLAALTIEKLSHKIFTCVELRNRDNMPHLAMAGVEEVVVASEYAGRIIAAASRTRGIVSMFDELLTARWGNQIYKADVPAEWIGRKVGWVHQELKEQHKTLLMALERHDIDGTHMQVNPDAGDMLAMGDQLVVIAEHFPAVLGTEKRTSSNRKA
ncbi:MAG TPA: ion transporter [Myxococcota bacterium]|nr:ion transporter [Myxococcota bacterium]HRY97182.1 ion transporter [Myxococcota bacterium]